MISHPFRLAIALAALLASAIAHAKANQTKSHLALGETQTANLKHELSPRRGVETPWQTEVRIQHDGKHLIVDVNAKDPEPSRLVVAKGQRDAITGDAISLRIDPKGDGNRAFVLTVNAAGAVADHISSTRGLTNASWNGRWEADASVESDGFRVRFIVPFTTIDVSPGAEGQATIGLAVRRLIGRGRQEILGWPVLDPLATCPDCANTKITLTSLERAAARWRFIPYLAATKSDQFDVATGERQDSASNNQAGIDIRYDPKPGRQLLLTINPDFSQVEIDSFQVEVNRRFALTFAERRPFFTENAGALGGGSLRLLYTRTITEPNWGVQGLFGLDEGQLALLLADDVRTSLIMPGTFRSRVVSLERASHNAAAQLTGRWSESLHHGLRITHRQADDYANSVVGGSIRWERDERHSLTLELAASHTRNPVEWQSAYNLDAQQIGLAGVMAHTYQGEVYSSSTQISQTGADFRADLGSLRRVGVRSTSHGSSWTFERDPETHRLSTWGFGMSGYGTTDRDDQLIFGGLDAFVGLGFRNGASLQLGHGTGRDREGATLFPTTLTSLDGYLPITERISVGASIGRGDSVDFDAAEAAEIQGLNASITYTGTRIRSSASTSLETLQVGGELRYRARVDNARLTFTPANRHQVNLIFTAYTLDEQGADTYQTTAGQIGYRYQRDAFTAFTVGISTRAVDFDVTDGLQETGRFLFAKLSVGF